MARAELPWSWDDYEPTGEIETMTDEEWWCPTDQRWSMCPGPCPDGTPHSPKRTREWTAKEMRRVAGDGPERVLMAVET